MEMLNIPKEKYQFEEVPFVNDMTPYQLKVLIKRIWKNLHELANVLDKKEKDISKVIDKILDGNAWSKKDIGDRYIYAQCDKFILQYDKLEKVFIMMDNEYNPIMKPIKGITISEIKRNKNERNKRNN